MYCWGDAADESWAGVKNGCSLEAIFGRAEEWAEEERLEMEGGFARAEEGRRLPGVGTEERGSGRRKLPCIGLALEEKLARSGDEENNKPGAGDEEEEGKEEGTMGGRFDGVGRRCDCENMPGEGRTDGWLVEGGRE